MNKYNYDMTVENEIIERKKKIRRKITDYLCKYATLSQLTEIGRYLKINV